MIDSLLVLLSLVGVGQTTVSAALTADSALILSAPAVYQLLGLGLPAAPTVTLDDLRRRFLAVAFSWQPRELAVVIEDPRGVLPATVTARSSVERVARGAFTALSGPFATFTADDAGRSATEAGYTWRGKVALSARRPAVGPTGWAATVAPVPALVASVAGDGQIRSATGRLAFGRAWLLSTWTPAGLSADALVALPHVALFASSRNAYVVTLSAQPVGVQLGRSGGRTVARITYGPVAPSPFLVPVP